MNIYIIKTIKTQNKSRKVFLIAALAFFVSGSQQALAALVEEGTPVNRTWAADAMVNPETDTSLLGTENLGFKRRAANGVNTANRNGMNSANSSTGPGLLDRFKNWLAENQQNQTERKAESVRKDSPNKFYEKTKTYEKSEGMFPAESKTETVTNKPNTNASGYTADDLNNLWQRVKAWWADMKQQAAQATQNASQK